MEMTMSEHDEIMQYPCEIAVKAMGRTDLEVDFEAIVIEIVRRHAPDIGEGAVTSRESRNGNYLAVTVRVMAESREQMDRIYQELCDHEHVTMAL
jgi:putative lipoic acid-binding regulatory protein